MSPTRFILAPRAAAIRPRIRRNRRAPLFCETLEGRQLLSTGAVATSTAALTAQTFLQVQPMAGGGSSGYSPQQIDSAYGISSLSFSAARPSRRSRSSTPTMTQHRVGPGGFRRPVWAVGPPILHRGQPRRHDDQRRLGRGDGARRRVGPRHCAPGQHRAGRGAERVARLAVERGQLGGQPAECQRRLHELGNERVLRGVEQRGRLQHPGGAYERDLRGGLGRLRGMVRTRLSPPSRPMCWPWAARR